MAECNSRSISNQRLDDIERDLDEAATMINMLHEHMVQHGQDVLVEAGLSKAGALIDRVLDRLGMCQIRGDASQWLFGPYARDLGARALKEQPR
jgi:myo-inositol catabolism protein IolC